MLDVGCGAGGALLPAAHRVGPTGRAVGIDIAPGHGRAHARGGRGGGLEQVEVEVMDGAALEAFEDGQFDAVLSAFSLSAMPDVERALAEWRRVLAPTGTLGVATWSNLVDDAWAWEGELNNTFAREVPEELLETARRRAGRRSTALAARASATSPSDQATPSRGRVRARRFALLARRAARSRTTARGQRPPHEYDWFESAAARW